jgi:hypothetical protein
MKKYLFLIFTLFFTVSCVDTEISPELIPTANGSSAYIELKNSFQDRGDQESFNLNGTFVETFSSEPTAMNGYYGMKNDICFNRIYLRRGTALATALSFDIWEYNGYNWLSVAYGLISPSQTEIEIFSNAELRSHNNVAIAITGTEEQDFYLRIDYRFCD